MEWTIGWWQVSVQRVYPTTTQLSQTYNQAASWWHQHLRLLGYRGAYRQLWRSLKNANVFDCVIISAHMLEHLPEPIQGLQEMVRILRPGAPLILVVTQSGLLGWLIQWYWGNRCFSQKELSVLMSETGLINLQFVPFPFGLARFTSLACIGFRRS